MISGPFVFMLMLALACYGQSEVERNVDKHTRQTMMEAVFLSSIYMNDISIVKVYIEEGGDVNIVNDEGFTALHIAVMHSYKSIVVDLLGAGANVNIATEQHGLSALQLAAMRGNLEIIGTLLTAGANVNAASLDGTALQFALMGRNWEAVIALLLAGGGGDQCKDKFVCVCQWGIENGFAQVTQMLLDQKKVDVNAKLEAGDTMLVQAAGRNDSALVQYLIQQGGDVNAATTQDMITPLQVAAMHNFVDIILLLLDSGARVNAADRHSITALRWTIVKNHVEAARILLSANATIGDAAAQNESNLDTLHFISSQNFVELGRVFLQLSGDIDVNRKMQSNGMTPLHVACISNHYDMAVMLIHYGADVSIVDDDGLTSYRVAVQFGYSDLVLLLQKAEGEGGQWSDNGPNHVDEVIISTGDSVIYRGSRSEGGQASIAI